MQTRNSNVEELTYELLLVSVATSSIFATNIDATPRLPSANIPKGTRVAKELQQRVRQLWGLEVIFVDISIGEEGESSFAVAEVLSSNYRDAPRSPHFRPASEFDLGEKQKASLLRASGDNTSSGSPFSRFGWITDAIEWVQTETGERQSPHSQVVQYNAGGQVALLRLTVIGKSVYWLKANRGFGECEFDVVRILAKLCPDALPELVAVHSGWGALLSKDAGVCLPDVDDRILEHAVEALAALQVCTVGHDSELLAAGVLDRSPRTFREHCEEIFDYLSEAMRQQTSVNVPTLTRERLNEMRCLAEETCSRLADLEIPNSIVHPDLNHGNLTYNGTRCRFLDWRGAYVGNPFVSFYHLLLLDTSGMPYSDSNRLKATYARAWYGVLSPIQIETALKLAPIVADLLAIYGRGDLLNSVNYNRPARLRYARNIARHLDREQRNQEFSNLFSSRSRSGWIPTSDAIAQ